MSIYARLKLKTIINAADSYTIIGGSLMPPEVVQAMSEASRHFVRIEELHNEIGARIAQFTRNEAAMITSGAAAGLAIATAACLTGMDADIAKRLPLPGHDRTEVIIHRCQRSGFDTAVRQAGAVLVEIGNDDATSDQELEQAINARTAAIIYLAGTRYERGALPLDKMIAAAGRHGIPVIVDAAAQLPPVDNLWAFTQAGAAMVIFSGGKTLRGPQSSGLIVGRKEWIAACRLNGSPNTAIGRPMKTGKEEMAGLLAAVERYVGLDHAAERARHERFTERICQHLNALGFEAAREYPGPTGQDYAQAKVGMGTTGLLAGEAKKGLEAADPVIMTGITGDGQALLINPLHLTEDELEVVLTEIERLL
ncbi:aminotransferase class V-fold PLP-dependent enzyme [Paenibacillus nasutitermitis]|uniref:Selenocysteine synthase n=1 Tax=Paenibacillus nasutitermitis TaxID=1652958 RepID=A0A916ZEX5_9BACL|nr:DegT/DnrJ/EryC1/StrS family aminotransferase [Paenibacillus nasutitermitis]GGD93164.1 selenocysteine synthase [Paenibacillus nasutitermitis]